MSDQHPTVDDDVLGTFTRATTDLDGDTLTHDWYVTTVPGGGLELMVEGTDPADVAPLRPRLREVIERIEVLQRLASDAVVDRFSTGEPEQTELDEAADDLSLDTIEASADGTIVLHFTDTCGEHFPEGYWPAVHLGADDRIAQVTVES